MTAKTWRGRFSVEPEEAGWNVVDWFKQPPADDPEGKPGVFTLWFGTKGQAEDYASYLRDCVRAGHEVNLTSAP